MDDGVFPFSFGIRVWGYSALWCATMVASLASFSCVHVFMPPYADGANHEDSFITVHFPIFCPTISANPVMCTHGYQDSNAFPQIQSTPAAAHVASFSILLLSHVNLDTDQNEQFNPTLWTNVHCSLVRDEMSQLHRHQVSCIYTYKSANLAAKSHGAFAPHSRNISGLAVPPPSYLQNADKKRK